MGLDVYAISEIPDHEGNLPLLPQSLFVDMKPCLTAGIFSCAGNGPSFRGAQYDDFVQYVCNMTLYENHIPNSEVRMMLAGINGFLAANPSRKTLEKLDITLTEVKGLQQWLKIVVDAKGGIHGWW